MNSRIRTRADTLRKPASALSRKGDASKQASTDFFYTFFYVFPSPSLGANPISRVAPFVRHGAFFLSDYSSILRAEAKSAIEFTQNQYACLDRTNARYNLGTPESG